jgi:hypothetical protein
MVTLNLDDMPGLKDAAASGRVRLDARERRIPWGLIVTIAIALVGWMYAALGAGVGDYSKVRDRVTTLEVQRVEDIRARERQRDDDQKWRDRVDSKLDWLIQSSAKSGGK